MNELVPPVSRSLLVWAFNASFGGGGQVHPSIIGPAATLGSTTGVDANDPVRLAKSYQFVGAASYLSFGDNLDATFQGAFTYQAVVNLSAGDVAAGRAICDKGLGSAEFRVDTGKPTLIANYDPTGFTKYDVYAANVALAAGKHVITFTRDPGLARGSRHALYVAGVSVAGTHTAVGVDGTISNTTSLLRLGFSTINSFVPVDQQRSASLWSGVLSAADILTSAKATMGRW